MLTKNGTSRYFLDIEPKLVVGGCFTAHNIAGRHGGRHGTREYARYVTRLKNFETTFNTDGAGVAISYKKSDR